MHSWTSAKGCSHGSLCSMRAAAMTRLQSRDPAEKRAVPSRCPPTCPVFVGDRATSGQGLVGEQRLLNPTDPDELDRQEQLASTRWHLRNHLDAFVAERLPCRLCDGALRGNGALGQAVRGADPIHCCMRGR